MEPDIQELLKKNIELTKENNKLLKKMRRNALLGGLIKIIWIAVIIGIPLYIYINFLAPVLDQVLGAAETVQGVGDTIQETGAGFQERIQGVIELFKSTIE